MSEWIQIVSDPGIGTALSVLLGLIWGSFFNVCISRLPQDQSVIFKPSHCPSCQALIPLYLNIPILSYLLLRGKCRDCHAKISIQYPLVELTSAVLFAWLFTQFGWSARFLVYTLFLSNLLVISIIDLYHQIIPDELSLSGIILGFLGTFLTHDISWKDSLIGILLGGGSFWLVSFLYEKIAKREGLGGGDIKLLAMIGATLGYQSILVVIILSSALGSLIGGVMMLMKRGNMKTAIPFGPFLACGALFYFLWGNELNSFFFPPISLD